MKSLGDQAFCVFGVTVRGMDPGSSPGVTCRNMAPESAAGLFCAVIDNTVSHLIQLVMKTIYTTEIFDGWFEALRDKQAARRILDLARQLKE